MTNALPVLHSHVPLPVLSLPVYALWMISALTRATATMIPGAYAISIEAQMPEDIYEQLTENNLRPHRILATAEKADADD